MPLDLYLHRASSDLYYVVNRKKHRQAELYFDYKNHIKTVVLYQRTSQTNKLIILRAVANHVRFYADSQEWVAGNLNTGLPEKRLPEDRFLDYLFISKEVEHLTVDQIAEGLKLIKVPVIIVHYKRTENALRAAIVKADVPQMHTKLIKQSGIYPNYWTIGFTVTKPHCFTFWKSDFLPDSSYDGIHIIPPYHPLMKGWNSYGLVNGDTNAFIGGNMIEYLYCPSAACTKRADEFRSSWGDTKHPFRAIGRSFRIQIDTNLLRTKEGVNELAKFLRAALNLDKQYIAISGGFDSPLPYPENVLNHFKIQSPYPHADYTRATSPMCRGSEHHCVWAYLVLQQEGQLYGAYIPRWFFEEKWLQIYSKVFANK